LHEVNTDGVLEALSQHESNSLIAVQRSSCILETRTLLFLWGSGLSMMSWALSFKWTGAKLLNRNEVQTVPQKRSAAILLSGSYYYRFANYWRAARYPIRRVSVQDRILAVGEVGLLIDGMSLNVPWGESMLL
jgi:hypothetical protein